MSHFAVLVITAEKPTMELLKKTLQPWHEYECTGEDDEYVIDVDIHDEVVAKYEADTRRQYQDADGLFYSPYDHQFYRELTPEEAEAEASKKGTPAAIFDNDIGGRRTFSTDWGDGLGYRKKVHLTAEDVGMTEIEVPVKELETMHEFAEGYWGEDRLKLIDGRYHEHTNPSKKWDWWSVGGRYNGKFKALKEEDVFQGRPGTMGEMVEGSWDVIQRSNMDWDAMKIQAVEGRKEWIDEIIERSKKSWDGEKQIEVAPLTFAEVEAGIIGGHAAHKEWMTFPDPKPRGVAYREWIKENRENGELINRVSNACWELPDVAEGQSLQEWIDAAPALSSYAMVHDGKWHQNGDMGWWGISTNEMDAILWKKIVNDTVENLDPTYWITTVDCHI